MVLLEPFLALLDGATELAILGKPVRWSEESTEPDIIPQEEESILVTISSILRGVEMTQTYRRST